MLKKVFLISCALYGALFMLPRFCYRRTGGFWYQTILSDLPVDQSQAIETPSNLSEINELLDQPFTFLSGGMQSFAFLGADGETILKFFKHAPSLMKKGRFSYHNTFVNPVLTSYHLANNHLKEESGLIYTHLNHTKEHHPTVKIIDKQKIVYQIALDKTEFILQKRADPLCATIRSMMKNGEVESAKNILRSLLDLQKKQYAHRLLNTDRACRRNYGVIDGRVMLFDAGSLINQATDNPRNDMKIKMRNLEKWLKKHYSQLDHFFNTLLQEE